MSSDSDGIPNWANKTIWTGDNLYIMRGMNSASVDLIYLDPPFNSNANYAAPIGSKAAGAAFKDTWTLTDIDVEWINLIEQKHSQLYRVLLAAMTKSDKSYLVYMAARLLEMKRLLKPTGSIYLHCDPTMSHYLKMVMDAIFGRSQFRNEIIWRIGWVSGFKTQKKGWIRNHDTILYYARQDIPYFEKEYIPYPEGYTRRDGSLPTGKGIPIEDTWNCNRADILDSIMIKSFSKEKLGFPTQKPLDLMKRIIKASCPVAGTVFDPFCGCATTCVAADYLGRNWIGIDISEKAAELVIRRIEDHQGLFRNIVHRTDIPERTDIGRIRRYNSPTNKKHLYGEQAGHCAGCGHHFQAQNLEVDHIISRKKGGSDHLDNLQLLCGHCNRTKGDRGMAYLQTKLQLAA